MVDEYLRPPWEFTEDDLIGVEIAITPEGQHLEYKRSELLKDRQNCIMALTKEVSAFNSAEGGAVILWIEESRREGPTVPVKVDNGYRLQNIARPG